MMGMHGESWVNNAIQEADLLLALRHALRRPRHRQPRAAMPRNAKKLHIDIDPFGNQQERPRRRRPHRRPQGNVLQLLLPQLKNDKTLHEGHAALALRDQRRARATAAVRDIINLPDNGHLYAAHVIHDIWRGGTCRGPSRTIPSSSPTSASTRCGKRSTSSTKAPRSLVTSRWARHDGLRSARGHRSEGSPAPKKTSGSSPGDGGFQMTAAELSTIVQENLRHQHRRHQ